MAAYYQTVQAFLGTVLCKRHRITFRECPSCNHGDWHFVYASGKDAVNTRMQVTGCSAEEAWDWWQDDRHSVAPTEAETIFYGNAADGGSVDTLSSSFDFSDGEYSSEN